MNRAAIKAVASYLPAGELTNEQLAAEFPEYTAEKIFDKTGIRIRHISADGKCASDLGVAAALHLFASRACTPVDIDFLIFCTQSPDYYLPATACVVQDRLGLRTDCGTIDMNQGCSGFVYGLSLAKGLIESGSAEKVLLITADTYSKFINPRDKSVKTLFGDGAAATLIEGIDADHELLGPFIFGSDGSGAGDLIVPAGGLRNMANPDNAVESEDEQGNWRSASNLYMNGGAIFSFTLKTVPETMRALLERSGLAMDDIDYFIPHQANKFMLDRLRLKMKIPADKFFCDMELTGNTVSSTIPIAFESAMGRGLIKRGDRVALIGFGVGLSWAATLMEVT
ncbi:MAG: ketoacyl-ACP synthase III [Pyrinomonadaceae bacterium]